MTRLRPRLQRLVHHVRPGEPLWDIGCDHGAVGLHALTKGLVPAAHFIDPAQNALPSRPYLAPVSLDRDRIHLYAKRAEDMPPMAVTGSVVCAGMGGARIQAIMTHFVLPNADQRVRLIVEPLTERDGCHKFLLDAGFGLVTSDSIVERKRTRKIDVLERRP